MFPPMPTPLPAKLSQGEFVTSLDRYIRSRPYFYYGILMYVIAALGGLGALLSSIPGVYAISSVILFFVASKFIIEQYFKAIWFNLAFPICAGLLQIILMLLGFDRTLGLLYSATLIDLGLQAFMVGWMVYAVDRIARTVQHRRAQLQAR